jgi:hypothetical protein
MNHEKLIKNYEIEVFKFKTEIQKLKMKNKEDVKVAKESMASYKKLVDVEIGVLK